jgi:hypothetical protein
MATEEAVMDKLIWELFLMVKELMPVTAENARRFGDWAARFHELAVLPGELEADHLPVAEREPEHVAAPSADDNDDDTPHVRSAPRRSGRHKR